MRRDLQHSIRIVSAVLSLATAGLARAQTGGPYALTWSVLGTSGGLSSGSGYSLTGTGGQPGAASLAGGGYLLTSGFWPVGGLPVAGVDDQPALPTRFRVYPSAPNPFSTSSTIALDLPVEQRVLMTVYDVRGERVRLLLDRVLPAGHHSMTWAGIGDDGRPLAPGVYWIRTQSTAHDHVNKVVILR